jgi:hypothetical protein
VNPICFIQAPTYVYTCTFLVLPLMAHAYMLATSSGVTEPWFLL